MPGPTGECAACRRKRTLGQPKLTIGQPGDRYEQEADRIAEQVMRMPDPRLQRQPLEEEEELLQPKPLAGPITPLMQRQPLEEEEELLQPRRTLHRQAGADGGAAAPPLVHDVLRGPGQPLDESTRAFMEPRFGHDFSRVRVHADSRAASSAQAVRAQAYTVGRNVVFGSGQYAPGTTEGKRLLAHELTHVVQQDQAPEGTAGRPMLQRRVVVQPPPAASVILGHFNTMCPGQFSRRGRSIRAQCASSSTQSCDCLCDTAGDPARTYTINVASAVGSSREETLHDGTTAAIPDSSLWPNTHGGADPTINMLKAAGSSIEFGFFKSSGRPEWYSHWRILAHELCGHARLNQSYAGSTGDRPGHDVTIDTENALAAEHGEPARGHYGDPRQGEAFYNPIGDRSRVAFRQVDGWHYEAP